MIALEYLANLLAYEFLLLAYLTPVLVLSLLVRMVDIVPSVIGKAAMAATAIIIGGWLIVGGWIAHNAATRHVLAGEGFLEAFANARRDVRETAWLYLAFLPLIGRLWR